MKALAWSVVMAALVIMTASDAHAQREGDDEDREGPKGPETSFVEVYFGAEFRPRQLNIRLVDSALEEDTIEMISLAERDRRLRDRFPENIPPIIARLEQDIEDGMEAYYNGDLATFERKVGGVFDRLEENLLALTLQPEFTDQAWKAGLRLVMYLTSTQQMNKRDDVFARLVRLFPTLQPDPMQYPPEILTLYHEVFKPSLANGYLLRVVVDEGCHARINGINLPAAADAEEGVSLAVLPGKYGLAEVCTGTVTRVFIVPVERNETVDFHGLFAGAFLFPESFNINASDFSEDQDKQVDLLVTLGRRIQVNWMVAAGLKPDPGGDPKKDQYRLFLVDAQEGRMIRYIDVPPDQVTTPERMDEALDSLLTGVEFEIIKEEFEKPTDWTFIGTIVAASGGALLLGGGVFAVLAASNQSEFDDCNSNFSCRNETPDPRSDSLQSRNRNALIADILFGTGAVVTLTGLTMILVHQLSGDGDVEAGGEGELEDEAMPEEEALIKDWQMGFAPLPEGGGFMSVGFTF